MLSCALYIYYGRELSLLSYVELILVILPLIIYWTQRWILIALMFAALEADIFLAYSDI